jgi:hypothetical protein
MNEQNSFSECLDLIARVLIRCFIGGVILLSIWFFAYLAAAPSIYHLHARWFSTLTREELDIIMYCVMATAKVFIIFVFLIPYVCLRLVLRKKS